MPISTLVSPLWHSGHLKHASSFALESPSCPLAGACIKEEVAPLRSHVLSLDKHAKAKKSNACMSIKNNAVHPAWRPEI
eukprot:702255-Pelagomonas_calceolata.AAC.4